ncbi:reverse transcriptase [Phytophthora megakarya]|uniref:Reverse transcriptase n=1 Tax=Phytophthora megakarya TaxID=4795 RepID=A0A225VMI6_9STRA|nr:reverse transcriptase [Phytophthora megakarya]
MWLSRFRASEMIRHDREPGGRHRPQANGTTERMVQTATRALKMYVRLDGMSTLNASPSRSTRPTIGFEEIPLIIWDPEINAGGHYPSRSHPMARPGSTTVVLSGPTALSAVTGTS